MHNAEGNGLAHKNVAKMPTASRQTGAKNKPRSKKRKAKNKDIKYIYNCEYKCDRCGNEFEGTNKTEDVCNECCECGDLVVPCREIKKARENEENGDSNFSRQNSKLITELEKNIDGTRKFNWICAYQCDRCDNEFKATNTAKDVTLDCRICGNVIISHSQIAQETKQSEAVNGGHENAQPPTKKAKEKAKNCVLTSDFYCVLCDNEFKGSNKKSRVGRKCPRCGHVAFLRRRNSKKSKRSKTVNGSHQNTKLSSKNDQDNSNIGMKYIFTCAYECDQCGIRFKGCNEKVDVCKECPGCTKVVSPQSQNSQPTKESKAVNYRYLNSQSCRPSIKTDEETRKTIHTCDNICVQCRKNFNGINMRDNVCDECSKSGLQTQHRRKKSHGFNKAYTIKVHPHDRYGMCQNLGEYCGREDGQ